ncbi:hypothetical protein H4582DRAFT_1208163 [Lactarius indigo]|nr:hypothetical protein H4582DRAFT_1208163 [Lactarius indigo]
MCGVVLHTATARLRVRLPQKRLHIPLTFRHRHRHKAAIYVVETQHVGVFKPGVQMHVQWERSMPQAPASHEPDARSATTGTSSIDSGISRLTHLLSGELQLLREASARISPQCTLRPTSIHSFFSGVFHFLRHWSLYPISSAAIRLCSALPCPVLNCYTLPSRRALGLQHGKTCKSYESVLGKNLRMHRDVAPISYDPEDSHRL